MEPTVEGAREDSALGRKYAELSRKYAALVQRLRRNVGQDLGFFWLGLWGLDASANGLAVVRGNQVTKRNARWLELDVAQGAGWVPADDEEACPYAELTQLARGEAARLSARAASAVRRFRRAGGEQILEVRVERPATARNVVLVVAHDVTERVRAQQDLTDMREALVQSEHLALLGELSSSVAHELGNTLRGISARASVLAVRSGEFANAERALIAGLQESAEAALGSVRKLQELVRTGRLEPGPVQLAEVVRHAADVLQLRQRSDEPRIDVQAAVERVPRVLGTVSELSHLFITLLFNARDAMPEGGRVEVRAERIRDRVRVTVSDEGTGISPEHLPQLFQPFFTTKGASGTGLGLWLAQSTMRRLGGTIVARNRKERGAEIEMEFQVAEGAQVRRVREPRRRSAPIARLS